MFSRELYRFLCFFVSFVTDPRFLLRISAFPTVTKKSALLPLLFYVFSMVQDQGLKILLVCMSISYKNILDK